MSIITCHWSVTPPQRIRDYHIEFGVVGTLDQAYINSLGAQIDPKNIDWQKLKSHFAVFKNNDLSDVTSYGTWHLNSDPRDHSSNIEIAALCMTGAAIDNWGSYPYTYAHAWMHAGIVARVAKLKGIDCQSSFSSTVESGVLQNGPIWVVSTHGERALQTNDEGEDTVPELGYFIYSGDGNCRWDLACLDPSQVHKLDTKDSAVATCKASASWIRQKAHLIKAYGIEDYWSLDKDPT